MDKIKQIRKSRGLTQAEAAAAIGLDLSNYNKLENGKTKLTLSRMRELAEMFRVEPEDLIISAQSGLRAVRVRSYVEAGRFDVTPEWNEEDWYDITIPDDPDLRPYKLFGAKVRGPSMNKLYPEGTVVIFTSMIDRPEQLLVGKRYVVEREQSDGMREATVKTLWRDETGKFCLIPESTDPRHQQPIDIQGSEGDTVRIVGRVVYAMRRED
jgi:transcriptional regulator with XRE-family HTH domain